MRFSLLVRHRNFADRNVFENGLKSSSQGGTLAAWTAANASETTDWSLLAQSERSSQQIVGSEKDSTATSPKDEMDFSVLSRGDGDSERTKTAKNRDSLRRSKG